MGADEWIAIRLLDDADRRAFLEVTGIDFRDEAAVVAFTAGHDKHALAARLQAGGIEAFPVLKPDEFTGSPQLRAREFFIDVGFGGGRSAAFPGSPLHPLADPRGPSPNFGEHTTALLEEIARLP
jgi:crotonobetainyl-CoA:carnitine CoA-transferase CaiB-like acyl-CoA transferase